MKRHIIFIIVLLVFLVSCATFEKIELHQYKWIYISSKIIDETVISFLYNEILFLEKDILVFYSLSGYSTISGKIVEVEKEDTFYLDYKKTGNEIIIFTDTEKIILKINKKGNLVLNKKIFIKVKILDVIGKYINT